MPDSTSPDARRKRYSVPWRNEPPTFTNANMRFGMPASWEDMEALGLDPLTGEVVG